MKIHVEVTWNDVIESERRQRGMLTCASCPVALAIDRTLIDMGFREIGSYVSGECIEFFNARLWSKQWYCTITDNAYMGRSETPRNVARFIEQYDNGNKDALGNGIEFDIEVPV
jgi:hypothetical protein